MSGLIQIVRAEREGAEPEVVDVPEEEWRVIALPCVRDQHRAQVYEELWNRGFRSV